MLISLAIGRCPLPLSDIIKILWYRLWGQLPAIGWAWLSPNIGRMLIGNELLVPVSISLGACLLLLVDLLARTVSGSEMPLSI